MTNREIALAVWILIAIIIVLAMSIKNIKLRESTLDFFRLIYKLFENFIMQFLFAYTLSILVLFIYLFHRWDFEFSLISTFLIFTITTYIPIIWNTILSDEVIFHYKEYYKQIISGAVVVAILVTSYTFSFIVEFALIVPSLLFLGMFKAYIDYNKKYEDVGNVVNKLISLIGFIILVNWGIQFARNFSDLLTLDFWLSFTVDFWGIIAYIPAILVLPHFLSIDRKIRYYESFSNLDYIKLHIYYWIINKKYQRRDKVKSFNIYKIKLDSKPFQVFSVYAEVDEEVDIEELNYDVQTFSLNLRLGNFNDYDKLESTKDIPSQNLNLYADVIYFYFSIKDEKRWYPWYKMYLWRNPRLRKRFMSISGNWEELDDNLLVRVSK